MDDLNEPSCAERLQGNICTHRPRKGSPSSQQATAIAATVVWPLVRSSMRTLSGVTTTPNLASLRLWTIVFLVACNEGKRAVTLP